MVSVPLVFSSYPPHLLHHFLQGRRDGRGGGALDAAVGAMQLSVVDLPDLSTVNRQGMSQSVLWPAESASLIHMSKHMDAHIYTNTHTHTQLVCKGANAAKRRPKMSTCVKAKCCFVFRMSAMEV